MSCPPSSRNPEDLIANEQSQIDATAEVAADLGLAKADVETAIRLMVAVVKRVGCQGHIHPLEVVHDAFVMATCKPISERPSITNRKKFFAWMCTLAEYAALSNRKSRRRRLLSTGESDNEIGRLLSAPGHEEQIAARDALHKALAALDPEERALIIAHNIDEKTIKQIAVEQNEPVSTVSWRHMRAMDRLRKKLQKMISVAIILFTKKARAQSIRISRIMAHAMHTTGATAVTIACGMLVPTSSDATVVHQEAVTAHEQPAAPNSIIATNIVPIELASPTEVPPEKPSAVDRLEKQCSASGMKSAKIVSYLHGTLVPFAFLVAPAVTQFACAGAERHSHSVEEREEDEGGIDPYEIMCANERRRGNDCPTKEEWYRKHEICPDGTGDCYR